MVREILLLGDGRLYMPSPAITRDELPGILPVIDDLHDTLMDYRRRHGSGRAIAAPQIGVAKRLIYMHTGKPVALINPEMSFVDDEMMQVLDDCMSFPGLLVRVMRRRRCRIDFLDVDWQPKYMELEGDLSELLQHEYDHLDGILATMRAVDDKAFVMQRCPNGNWDTL